MCVCVCMSVYVFPAFTVRKICATKHGDSFLAYQNLALSGTMQAVGFNGVGIEVGVMGFEFRFIYIDRSGS